MTTKKQDLFQYLENLMSADTDPASYEQEIWRRYGKTLAVLILDSSGFTRVSKSHGIIHFLSRLMSMRQSTKSVFEAHHCKDLRFEADNTFAIFDNVDNAITCALKIHEAVYLAEIMLTDTERFQVSIGVGFGEMLYSETSQGCFSEEMNYASKLGEDTAEGGETLITDNARLHAANSIVADFTQNEMEISGVSLIYHRHQFDKD